MNCVVLARCAGCGSSSSSLKRKEMGECLLPDYIVIFNRSTVFNLKMNPLI